jgi:membrane protein DedA with SNARE-associated domain
MKDIGAVTMGLSALMPPPFPMTAFILTSGALKVPMARFLLIFATARLVRFGTEALLARRFGTSLLQMFESKPVQAVAIGLVIVAIVGTAITIVRVWRHS